MEKGKGIKRVKALAMIRGGLLAIGTTVVIIIIVGSLVAITHSDGGGVIGKMFLSYVTEKQREGTLLGTSYCWQKNKNHKRILYVYGVAGEFKQQYSSNQIEHQIREMINAGWKRVDDSQCRYISKCTVCIRDKCNEFSNMFSANRGKLLQY